MRLDRLKDVLQNDVSLNDPLFGVFIKKIWSGR